MSLSFPDIETAKQIVGEYPLRQVGEQAGLFDRSDATYGDRAATNLEVLEVLAKLAGGKVYITNPVSLEGREYNSSLNRNFHGENWATDIFRQTIVFERPV